MAGSKMAELAAEVRALREDVQRLREAQSEHVCPHVYYYPPMGAAPLPWYQVVSPTYIGDVIPGSAGWYSRTNVCAGAAGQGFTNTFMLSTAGAQ
jgi:hypothetical protein